MVAILETGRRTATYKLATLMALIDHCTENLPGAPDDALPVPIRDLAHRVLELYWPQVRPFDGHELRQSTQPHARILRAASELRTATGSAQSGISLDTAALKATTAYQDAIADVALCLARQPLHRLQKLPGSATSNPFLYDDAFLHDKVSLSTLRDHGNAIALKPGVAHGLARLAGLLKPTLEIMWVDDVRRMNTFLGDEFSDVADHLFGRRRIDLAPVSAAFKEEFSPHCFYCRDHLRAASPIDHVLPWSRVGLDGLSNLVLACQRCNNDKSNTLPAMSLMGRVLEPERQARLEQIASELRWPTQHHRVVSVANRIYGLQPRGTPTWSGYKQIGPLDIGFPPNWS